MSTDSRTLSVRPLTREAFAPFGQVIETAGAEHFDINGGTTTRFHDLADVELGKAQGSADDPRALVSIFRGQPFAPPVTITMLERHPLGSQAFMPLSPRPFLVVVAPDEAGRPGVPVAFLALPGNSLRGVNYRRNVWHHPLLSLEAPSDFLVVDRGGEGDNLEEFFFDNPFRIESLAS